MTYKKVIDQSQNKKLNRERKESIINEIRFNLFKIQPIILTRAEHK